SRINEISGKEEKSVSKGKEKVVESETEKLNENKKRIVTYRDELGQVVLEKESDFWTSGEFLSNFA
ncbi:7296_t:CDS:2, partial [Rhizophagus irregularis]